MNNLYFFLDTNVRWFDDVEVKRKDWTKVVKQYASGLCIFQTYSLSFSAHFLGGLRGYNDRRFFELS